LFRSLGPKENATETKAAQLSRSAEFLGSLLEQITQPFVVVDAQGRLLFWNRAFEELTNYGASDLAALQTLDLILWQPGPRRSTGPPGEAQTGTPELRVKGNLNIPVELRFVPVQAPEGEPLTLILVDNLSERQRLEEELRQSHKMEAIGRLAGGIAHDFNNVLTTIIGLTESMINGRLAPTSESLREIHHAGLHAAELTHSLLAFSRRQILQMKSIHLDAVMENIARMVGRLIGEDIRLQISAEKDLPPIRADQSQIEQVLLNLCLNARDAMPQGGDLRITARLVNVNAEWAVLNKGARPGIHVVLSVQDTGEGMDEETLRHVFEPFFTRKAPGKGTGLGLSMVYGIVKQHDAFIKVGSTIGVGTEFSIYFSPSSVEPEKILPREPAVSEKGSATILVVEDEKSVRRLVLEALSNLGYRTFAAANGE